MKLGALAEQKGKIIIRPPKIKKCGHRLHGRSYRIAWTALSPFLITYISKHWRQNLSNVLSKSLFFFLKKYVPIILVALRAHHTPNSTSRNGPSTISLGCTDNNCLLFWIYVRPCKYSHLQHKLKMARLYNYTLLHTTNHKTVLMQRGIAYVFFAQL